MYAYKEIFLNKITLIIYFVDIFPPLLKNQKLKDEQKTKPVIKQTYQCQPRTF